MKLIEIDWNPSQRRLRQFGMVCLFALPLVGWLWGGTGRSVGLLAGVGFLLAIGGFAFPKSLKPIFIGLTILAAPIGIVIGELAMLLVYFGVFLPIGLVFRVLKRDALRLRFDKRAETYWQPKKPPGGPAGYYRQS